MTPGRTALTLAALLQVVHYLLCVVPANLKLGPGETMSPRGRTPLKRCDGAARPRALTPTLRPAPAPAQRARRRHNAGTSSAASASFSASPIRNGHSPHARIG